MIIDIFPGLINPILVNEPDCTPSGHHSSVCEIECATGWQDMALLLTDELLHHKPLEDENMAENAEDVLEFLWGGIEILANETIKIEDEELASLRPAKHLLWLFQHKVPKNPAGIEEYLDHFSHSDTPITPEEFEELVLTTVFAAYQIRIIQGLDKNLWISLFSRLVAEIIRELCKQFCPQESLDSVHLLASRPWQEIPAYIGTLKKFYQSRLTMTQN